MNDEKDQEQGDAEDIALPGQDDVESVANAIAQSDKRWRLGDVVTLAEGLRWKPDLLSDDPPAILHVHITERLRPYAVKRLAAAPAAGFAAYVALNVEALYDEDLLIALATCDAHIVLIEGDGSTRKSAPLLALLADEGIVVSPSMRSQLGRTGWDLCKTASTNHLKGVRLEALLAFLLSQVDDFKVAERNLRTDTEEIDIVIQQRTLGSERCWCLLGAPFILVEAKNWSVPVGKPLVSDMRVKMLGRRGTVRLAFLVGASGFTGDAFDQEMRFSGDQETIAFIGPEHVTEWIDAVDGDKWLEDHVRSAMLR